MNNNKIFKEGLKEIKKPENISTILRFEKYGIPCENLGLINKEKYINQFFEKEKIEINGNVEKIIFFDNINSKKYAAINKDTIVAIGKVGIEQEYDEKKQLIVTDNYETYLKLKQNSEKEIAILDVDKNEIKERLNKSNENVLFIGTEPGYKVFFREYSINSEFVRSEKFLLEHLDPKKEFEEKVEKFKLKTLGDESYAKYKNFKFENFCQIVKEEIKKIPEIEKKIEKAIKENKNIKIIHDFDADGISAGAKLKVELEKFGVPTEKIICICKNRNELERGMTLKLEEKIDKEDLLICVDLGSNDIDAFSRLNKQGSDVIVIDHHEDSGNNKKFYEKTNNLIYNPKFSEKTMLGSSLSSVGLISLLGLKLNSTKENITEKIKEEIPIMNFGIKVDMVDYEKGNEIINVINTITNEKENQGFLFNLFGQNTRSEEIGFSGSIINKLSKTGNPEIAFKFCEKAMKNIPITSEEREMAEKLLDKYKIEKAEVMSEYNYFKTNEEVVFFEIDSKYKVYSSEIRSKVTGYPKTKIALLITDATNEELKISAGIGNSYSGIKIEELKKFLGDTVLNIGGHSKAFGMVLKKEKLEELKEKITDFSKEISKRDKNIEYFDITDFSKEKIKDLYYLLSNDVNTLAETEVIIKEKIDNVSKLEEHYCNIEAKNIKLVSFNNTKETGFLIQKKDCYGVVGDLRRNIYNGNESFQVYFEGTESLLTNKNFDINKQNAIQELVNAETNHITENMENIKTNVVGINFIPEKDIAEFILENPEKLILKKDYNNPVSQNAVMVGYEKNGEYCKLGFLKEKNESGYETAKFVNAMIINNRTPTIKKYEITGEKLKYQIISKIEKLKDKREELQKKYKKEENLTEEELKNFKEEKENLKKEYLESIYISLKYDEAELKKIIPDIRISQTKSYFNEFSNEVKEKIKKADIKPEILRVISSNKEVYYSKENLTPNFQLTKASLLSNKFPKFEKIKDKIEEKNKLYSEFIKKNLTPDLIKEFEEKYPDDIFNINNIGINMEIVNSIEKKKYVSDEVLDFKGLNIKLIEKYNPEEKQIIIAEGPNVKELSEYIIAPDTKCTSVLDVKSNCIIKSLKNISADEIIKLPHKIVIKSISEIKNSKLIDFLKKDSMNGTQRKIEIIVDKKDKAKLLEEKSELKAAKNNIKSELSSIIKESKTIVEIKEKTSESLKELKTEKFLKGLEKILELTKKIRELKTEKNNVTKNTKQEKLIEQELSEVLIKRNEKIDNLVNELTIVKHINCEIINCELLLEKISQFEEVKTERQITEFLLNIDKIAEKNDQLRLTDSEKTIIKIKDESYLSELISMIEIAEKIKSEDLEDEKLIKEKITEESKKEIIEERIEKYLKKELPKIEMYKQLNFSEKKIFKEAIKTKDFEKILIFLQKDCKEKKGLSDINLERLEKILEKENKISILEKSLRNKDIYYDGRIIQKVIEMYEKKEFEIETTSASEKSKIFKNFSKIDKEASYEEMNQKIKYFEKNSENKTIMEKILYETLKKAAQEKITNTMASEINHRKQFIKEYLSQDCIKALEDKVNDKYTSIIIKDQIVLNFTDEDDVLDILESIIKNPEVIKLLCEREKEEKPVIIEFGGTNLKGIIEKQGDVININFGTEGKVCKNRVIVKNEVNINYEASEEKYRITSITLEKVAKNQNYKKLERVEGNRNLGQIYKYMNEEGKIVGGKRYLDGKNSEIVNEKLREFITENKIETEEAIAEVKEKNEI